MSTPALSPYLMASAVYDHEPSARTFEEDVVFHLMHGFVFSTPDYFIMGRPVHSKAPQGEICGQRVFSPSQCDCWHVWAMASLGNGISKAWGILPWPLPLMSYERKNELRVMPLAVMRRILEQR